MWEPTKDSEKRVLRRSQRNGESINEKTKEKERCKNKKYISEVKKE